MRKKAKEEVFKKHPKLEPWKKTVLALPIVLSLSWIFYLQYNISSGSELLSPAQTAPLIIALVLFTLGYVIFLSLMFSENIQNFIWRMLGH